MGNKQFGKSKKVDSTAMPNKIIFLDIDGVLNNSKSDVTQLYVMEPDLLKLLKKILEAVPGCGLVLSSTWRYTKTTRELALEKFSSVDLPSYISCTPNLGTNRVDEILCWLKENTDSDEFGIHLLADLPDITTSKYDDELPRELLTKHPKLHITHFIAIDDMDLRNEPSKYTEHITPRFVLIDKKVGLTEANVKHAIGLLQ